MIHYRNGWRGTGCGPLGQDAAFGASRERLRGRSSRRSGSKEALCFLLQQLQQGDREDARTEPMGDEERRPPSLAEHLHFLATYIQFGQRARRKL